VYPKPSEFVIPFPEGEGRELAEACQSKLGGYDEFSGIRPYQAGDSIRQIYWKGYAKGQGLNTKQYASYAGGAEIYLDLTTTPGSHLEDQLSQLCRWVVDAERSGLRYGLSIPTANILPNSGESHYLMCLEALALY
jgi:uncharacterized protein (DUF58 family)